MSETGPPDEQVLRVHRRLLAYLGTAMIATGQTVDVIEDEVQAVGDHLGHPDVQVAGGPTGVHVCLASGAPTTFESVNGPLRLDQAADVATIRYQIMTDALSPEAAIERLLGLRTKPPLYPPWVATVGYVVVTVGITFILQPGWANVLVAGGCGAVAVALSNLARRHPTLLALLPTITAFVVACIVFSAADAGLLDGALRTVLPPLAVLLPGALLVSGISELASGDMVAGSARVAYGAVQLLLFALGLVAAAALLRTPAGLLGNVRVESVGWWAPPVGLLLIALGISAMESVSPWLAPWVLAVLVLAFCAQLAGQHLGSPVLGSFLGAVAASAGSRACEALQPKLPRLVVFLPAFWLLVPGSLGLLGVSEVAIGAGPSDSVGFDAITVIGAIAVGLLVGAVIARTTGRALRLRRHPEPTSPS